MKIGERIKKRRKELHISIDELSKMTGKNRATLYRYENGEIEKIPLDILEPIANALQTTPHELMGWDENQSVSGQQLELLLDDDINEIFIDFKSLSYQEKKSGKGIDT